jgi:hypothetical protein
VLKRKQQPSPAPSVPTEAICVEGFRPGVIAPLIERYQRLPIEHELVRNYPEFWRGLFSLSEEVNDG